jgi:hypothetical protein
VGGTAAGEHAASTIIKLAHSAMSFFADIDQEHLCCVVARHERRMIVNGSPRAGSSHHHVDDGSCNEANTPAIN